MYYLDSHEWIQVEGEKGIVGILQRARQDLGEIIYVQLPEVGREVKAGEEVVVLESTKAASDIYSPVSGIITKINEALQEDLGLINYFPEKEGYLFEIFLTHPDELEKLTLKGEDL